MDADLARTVLDTSRDLFTMLPVLETTVTRSEAARRTQIQVANTILKQWLREVNGNELVLLTDLSAVKHDYMHLFYRVTLWCHMVETYAPENERERATLSSQLIHIRRDAMAFLATLDTELERQSSETTMMQDIRTTLLHSSQADASLRYPDPAAIVREPLIPTVP